MILATAKPSWVRAENDKEPELKKEGAWQTLSFVEEKLIGESEGEVAVTLSGDHHFYAHYAKRERRGAEAPDHRGRRRRAFDGDQNAARDASSRHRTTTRRLRARTRSGATLADAGGVGRDARRGAREGDHGVTWLGAMIGGIYALIALAFSDAVKDHGAGLAASDGGYSFGELLWDGGSHLVDRPGAAAPRRARRVGRGEEKAAAEGAGAAALHWATHLALALAAPVVFDPAVWGEDRHRARRGCSSGGWPPVPRSRSAGSPAGSCSPLPPAAEPVEARAGTAARSGARSPRPTTRTSCA